MNKIKDDKEVIPDISDVADIVEVSGEVENVKNEEKTTEIIPVKETAIEYRKTI